MYSDNVGLILMLLSMILTFIIAFLGAKKGSVAIILLSLTVMLFYSATFKVYFSIISYKVFAEKRITEKLKEKGFVTEEEYLKLIK
mgnify:CR=1 FL=1